jgi:secretion/DNA translocation related TadE-like protein
MNAERGSAAILVLGVAGLVMVLTIGVADVGLILSARLEAAAAADAAALAAAPVTFRPFGAAGTPAAEANRLASANGSVLISCRCRIDRSWHSRMVEVDVQRRVRLIGLGSVTVTASSRAEFDPTRLLGDPERHVETRSETDNGLRTTDYGHPRSLRRLRDPPASPRRRV